MKKKKFFGKQRENVAKGERRMNKEKEGKERGRKKRESRGRGGKS